MRYFFVEPDHITETGLVLQHETAHHVRNVLRKRPGDILHVSDGVTACYRVVIEGFSQGTVHCGIQEQSPLDDPSGPRVVLLFSLPKGNRMDWLVQKATEVGVAEFMPVTMERSVREIDPNKADHWMHRWRKIAVAAAGQCGRFEFPVFHPPQSFPGALSRLENVSLKLFADREGEKSLFHDLVKSFPATRRISVLVGPEGGMTADEKALLLQAGHVPVTLGETVLRVETAGILAVALVRYAWGDGMPATGMKRE